MAKNTYRDDTLHVGRKNEVRGKNEPRRGNVPKSEMHKQSKKKWSFKMPSFSLPSINLNIGFLQDRRFKLTIGFTFLLLSFCMTIAFVSYLFTGNADQSVVASVGGTGLKESGKRRKLAGAIRCLAVTSVYL